MKEEYFTNDLYWKNLINKNLDVDMWIDEYKSYFFDKGNCLDLGCGKGEHSKRLIEYGYNVISTDISPIALNEVKKFNKNVELVDMSKPLKYSDSSFDLVFSNLAIHYFSEKQTFNLLDEIYRVLKSGGLFVGSVNDVEKYNFIKDTAIKVENNFYYDNGKYLHLFDEEELKKYFTNFKILELKKREVERFGKIKKYWIFIIQK